MQGSADKNDVLSYDKIGVLVVDLIFCSIVVGAIYAGCSVHERLWKKSRASYRLSQLVGVMVGVAIVLAAGFVRVKLFNP